MHLTSINSIVVFSVVLLSLHDRGSASDTDPIVQQIINAESRYRECEFAYHMSSIPGDPTENNLNRFGGGEAGYQAFKKTGEFLLASNRYSIADFTSEKVREDSRLPLEGFRLLFIGNARYKAMLKQVNKSEYQLAEQISASDGRFSASNGRRSIFAPLIDLDLQHSPPLVNRNATFDETDAISLTTIANNNGSWEKRSMFFDPKTFECLGHENWFSSDEKFAEVRSKDVYQIEYDSESQLPLRYVRTYSGKYEFTAIFEFTRMTFGKSDEAIFFLKHYGIEE